jgi:outer membrane protein OmpA-like peptidoglycan-associated protein
MSRSPRAAALLALAALAALPGAARAQDDVDAGIVDVELPVQDIVLTSTSLDNSVQTGETDKQVKVTLAADVLFKFDKATLSPRARSRIAEVSRRIRAVKPSILHIDGYTDSKGSDAYNLGLSRRRAAAVAAVLRKQVGEAAPTFAISGQGESDPVAANTNKDGSDNPKGRARNRRVTITFPK